MSTLVMDYEAVPRVVAEIVEDATTIHKAAGVYYTAVKEKADKSGGAIFLVKLAKDVKQLETVAGDVVKSYNAIQESLGAYIRQFKALEEN